jgi:phenylpyruvate tautomerase PptA (4-oxalocrotonate tautomerase family)
MPLVRIALPEHHSHQATTVGDCVHRAMVETINVPSQDRFQIITRHSPTELVYDPSYLGIERSRDFLAIQITLNGGRTVDQKRVLYARIAALLEQDTGCRKEDILISLVEVAKENWSFGNGIAQYA